MANLPYITGNESKVLGIMKMYSRMGAYPLDATSVFNTKAELEAYINETGSYAYPGQVVAVANKETDGVTDSTYTGDYSLYVIRSNKTVQEIGKNLTFSTYAEAVSFITDNGDRVKTGELVTVAGDDTYELYMIKADKSLIRVSFETSDIPTVSWANLQDKPTSTVVEIDDAVSKKHSHTNKTELDKIGEADSKPTYDGNELAYKTDITWTNLGGKQTTLAGYGITDAVNSDEVKTVATANKLLKLNAEAKLPADITGNAATATNVAWTGVTGTPTDLAGYGITDAVKSDEIVATATANKILKLNADAKLPASITGEAGSVAWSGVTGTPTDLAGYGITDAYTKDESDAAYVPVGDVVTTAAANKILKLDAEAKLPASVISGVLSIENIPHGALERCVVVADDTARFALTTDKVQTGDTVKVTESGKMYFVKDDTKLNSENGYEVYTAGSASTVAWSGVTGTPTTLGGYGITDAVSSDDVVSTATADKLLKLDANAKLPASITGDADTVDGKHAADFVLATDVVDTATANKILKLNASGTLDADITGNAASASKVDWTGIENKPTSFTPGSHASAENTYGVGSGTLYGHVKLSDATDSSSGASGGIAASPAAVKAAYDLANGKAAAKHSHISSEVTDAVSAGGADNAGKLLKVDSTGKIAVDTTGNAKTATNVAWTGVTGTPTTVAGYGITDTYTKAEADNQFLEATQLVDTPTPNAILAMDENGKLPTDITGNAATASEVDWSGVKNTPTTIAGYGITDVVSSNDIVTTATANKVLKLNADAKLPADITGNAKTATNVAWSGVTSKPTSISGYGITDAYTKDEANTTFVAATTISDTAAAGKLLKLDSDGKLPASITGEAGSVAWGNITGKQTTISGYGITDAYTKTEADAAFVPVGDVATTATANKLLKLDANAKLPASVITGVLSIENIPHGALERCVVVANDTARFALTANEVQTGDTVKVTATSKMYFVVDDSKLSTEAGYEVYTAGSATSVAWSGVTGTPTTVAGYGITDVYTKSDANSTFVAATEVVDTAAAGKVLKLDANSKLPASITGEAGSVAWANINDKPTSSVADIDAAVTAATHANRTQLDKIGENASNKLTYTHGGTANVVAYMSDLTSVISYSATEPTDLPVGGLWFQPITN